MNKTNVIAVIVAVVILGGGGYALGKSSGDMSANTKERQDSIVMMKKQSASIQVMGEMMKVSGVFMQELGAKYEDADAVSRGKDLEAIGEKYLQENEKAIEGDESMKKNMLGN